MCKFEKPNLYIFSGLSGTGKSTLAKLLAERSGSFYLNTDTIDKVLNEPGKLSSSGERYRMAHSIAGENLKLGLSVIIDCYNPCTLTRKAWENVAYESFARFVNIEVICSDEQEHKRRVLERHHHAPRDFPTWEDVKNQDYEPWHKEVIRVDTAGKRVDQAYFQLKEAVNVSV